VNEKVNAFNEVAHIYDDWYEHPQGKHVFMAERNAVNSLIPRKGLGLEVGAGTGEFAKSLEKDERVIVCLDPSREMLLKAKEKGTLNILGYGHHLPFRPVFDFSYMITVIEFLDNPVETLNEISKVIKDGSPFTLLFINSDSSWGALYEDIGSKGDTVFQHARFYSLPEIYEILEKGGYKIILAKGTLSSDPMSPTVRGELVEPSDASGVVVVKSVLKSY